MNKGKLNIKPAKDDSRTYAVRKIAKKYHRTMDWAYKVSRRDKSVQDGEYYKVALADYEVFYSEFKKILG